MYAGAAARKATGRAIRAAKSMLCGCEGSCLGEVLERVSDVPVRFEVFDEAYCVVVLKGSIIV